MKHPRTAGIVERLETRSLLSAAAVNINLAETHQTIEGFGAAMIDFKDVAEYHSPAFFDKIVSDLGATMARVPIPPAFENSNDDNDPDHFNWDGYDFSSLDYAMDFLKQLKDRGVSKFMMTPWSPPYWMKTSRSHNDGGQLRADMRDEYAEYLAAVVVAARDRYGITIDAVSLQNEPLFVEPYNSAIYNPTQIRETLRAVSRKFSELGLTTKIIVTEDMARADRLLWYVEPSMTDPQTQNANVVFAGHAMVGPQDLTWMRESVEAYNKQFWMTETSGQAATWTGAMALAYQMHYTLVNADASLWSYWQWNDTSENSQYALMVNGNPTGKYWVSRQFYRYIRPGAVRVTSTSTNDKLLASSFRQPGNGATTIVLVNDSNESADTTIHLSGANLPGKYRVIRSSSTENGVELTSINASNNFAITVPAKSVVTLYSGTDFAPATGGAMNTPFLPAPYEAITQNALARGALKGFVDSVQAILAGGTTDVNESAADGTTALHAAMANPGKTAAQITQMLLDAGADVNATTTDGWTPLHSAAVNTFMIWKNDATIPLQRLQLLLNAGANPNAKDLHNRTPLHWAAMTGKTTWDTNWSVCDPSLVQALINAGANVNVEDDFGMTPLDYATREGYEPIRQALINAGAFDHSAVYGTVFNDPNSNGVLDAGEKKLAGWSVYLDLNNNGVREATEPRTLTDSAGNYAFSGLAAGTHHVKFVLPADYRKTLPGSGVAGYDVAVVNGSVAGGKNFGATTNIRLAGRVTNEATSLGIAGVVVNIVSNNMIVATRTTDTSGNWQVKGLSAGSGEAHIVTPAGYVLSTPAGGKYTGTMSNGQQNANLNFGLRPLAATPYLRVEPARDEQSIDSLISDLAAGI